MILQVSVVLL